MRDDQIEMLEGIEPEITLADEISCIEREIKMRHQVYPRWVETGKMKQGEADREIAVMQKVYDRLDAIRESDNVHD